MEIVNVKKMSDDLIASRHCHFKELLASQLGLITRSVILGCFFFTEPLGKNGSVAANRPRPTTVVTGMNSSKTALLSQVIFIQNHTSVSHHDLLVKSTTRPSLLYGMLCMYCAVFYW